MGKNKTFIFSLSPADILTLTGLFFAYMGLIQILLKNFYLAISFSFAGMIADLYDGWFARKFRWESSFGRYLDGFVDSLNFLINPIAFLYMYGVDDMISLSVFFIFISSGIIRLSTFNIVGNKKEGDHLTYVGLPVFWSQFLLVFLFGLSFIIPKMYFIAATDISLLTMSILMVLQRSFLKPKRYKLITVILTGVIVLSLYFHSKPLMPIY